MNDDTPDDARLHAALAALPCELAPPATLESRVLRAVRNGFRLQPEERAVRRSTWTSRQVAAAAAIFAIGLATGWVIRPGPTPSSASAPRFMLLLYEGPTYQPGAPRDSGARVIEYGNWARSLARDGVAITGERLADGGVAFERSEDGLRRAVEDGESRLAGYFAVSARSLVEAERIAATCPHLRYGGRVVVKQIDTTPRQ